MAALRDRDLEAAVALYETDATVILNPGMLAKGTSSIHAFFEGIFSLKSDPKYEVRHLTEAGDLALFTAKWTIVGPLSPNTQVSRTNYQAVVLRKQADGGWLIAVDNPWGPGAASK